MYGAIKLCPIRRPETSGGNYRYLLLYTPKITQKYAVLIHSVAEARNLVLLFVIVDNYYINR